MTTACALALSGCKDEPVGLGEDGTGATSMVAPTSTDSGDDSPDDFSDDDPDDDPDDGGSGTTTEDPDTGSGSLDGTGSTSDTTGTPCTPGEEDCECTEEDPQCEEGLVCIVDVCAVPMCPEDDNEPANSDHLTPVDLGSFDDGDPGDSVVSILSGPADVDWWSYDCQDTLVPEADPAVEITQESPLQVCQYIECVNGGNAVDVTCPGGTTADTAPILNQFGGPLPGCCGSDNFAMTAWNCPDSSDDSVVVYLEVSGAMVDDCVDYQIDFHC